ncbi:MAG: outer membrane beta-barrel protein [Cyclobacteriaceae bacterium]
MMNNKYLIVTAMILLGSLISFNARSQAALLVLIFGDDVATEKFHFSLDGGINVAEMTNLNGKSFLLPNFGLGAHLKLSERWTFAPEFKPLSGRGEKKISPFIEIPEDIADDISSAESRVKLNYIDLPILFRYKAGQHWYFAAGPQISFRTSAQALTLASLDNGREIEVVDPIEDLTEWYDFSFPLEVGYNFAQSSHLGGIDIRVRFAPGFVNVVETDESSFKNNVIQFIASFPFLKKPEEE